MGTRPPPATSTAAAQTTGRALPAAFLGAALPEKSHAQSIQLTCPLMQVARLKSFQLVRTLPFTLLVNLPVFTWGFVGGREGGVRGISFVSGGFLPEKQRGTHLDEYIHVCDWLSTFS